ncbi:hypothetical protein I6F37_42265, partial [Bradyrhizobium sp. NBAIM08]|nr:hypothetical protein [Bradyrhizobium sp. NBAIM08]
MNPNKNLRGILFLSVVISFFLTVSCVQSPEQNSISNNAAKNTSGKIRIGFLMDTLQQERWQKDREFFVRRAEELGAEVLVQTADGKDEVQIKQAESLLT